MAGRVDQEGREASVFSPGETVAVPKNGLCPGISWGAPPHGPQTQLGQDCPPFFPPVPGANHGSCPTSRSCLFILRRLHLARPTAGTWPMLLTPCPCGPERSPRRADGMKEHVSAGVTGPRPPRARVQIQLRLLNGRFLLCKRVDPNTYVMGAAALNA